MQIVIRSTDTLTQIDGVPVRHWRGVTDSGIPCEVFVHRIAVRDDHDAGQFEAELAEQLPPAGPIMVRAADIVDDWGPDDRVSLGPEGLDGE